MRSSSFYLSPLHNVTKRSFTGKDKWKTLARVGVDFNSRVIGYELLLLLLLFVGECSADVVFHHSVTVAEVVVIASDGVGDARAEPSALV